MRIRVSSKFLSALKFQLTPASMVSVKNTAVSLTAALLRIICL